MPKKIFKVITISGLAVMLTVNSANANIWKDMKHEVSHAASEAVSGVAAAGTSIYHAGKAAKNALSNAETFKNVISNPRKMIVDPRKQLVKLLKMYKKLPKVQKKRQRNFGIIPLKLLVTP